MSDIRFNQWLHNSGTGGISQDSAGHVGIGTTVPTHINALTNNNSILHVGIVSCNTLNAASKIEGSIDDWIIHQDDTNTKFGFPTTDTFTVETAGSEALRITNTGHIVTQGLTSYSFNNDTSSAKVLEVTGDGTVGEYGVINISGNQDANNTQIGALKFINRQNSNGSSGGNAGSKQVAAIQAYIKSDGNGDDDSGGFLTFHTKGEADVNGERARIDSTGRVLIGGTAKSTNGDGRLIVYSSDKKHPAIKCAGTSSSSANGWTMLGDNYLADESQVNLGVSYSSSSFVISRCVKVSDTADNVYLSSQDSYNCRPTVFRLDSDGSFSFLNTSTNATVATDSAVTLTEKLRITSAGLVGIGTDISGGGGAYGRLSVVIPSQSGGSALQVMNSAAGSSDGDLTNIVLRSVNNSGTQWAGAEFRAYDYSFKNQGTAALSITSSGDVSISSNGNVHGISKLTVLPAGRTTAFSASDGDTWHDVVLKQTGSATNNAVGIAFETSTSGYHKNAGTGIAAVKNGTNSDYGSDLVFITRPQSAVAAERLRIKSDGSMLHTRSDNVQRHDVEFRQTGGIGSGNFGGIKWTQGSTGGTFLSGITIAYHDTGRPAMVFYQRDGGGTGSRQTVNIDRDGTMIIGEATDAALAVNQSTGRGVNLTASGRVYCKTADHWDLNRVGTGEIIRFRKGADSGTQTHVGNITVNSSSVTYSQNASDSRLKKNIETWTDEVLPHFKTLQPKKFNYNWETDTDTKSKGYMAQDVTSVFPEAYPMSKVDVDGSEEDRYMFAPGGMVIYLMKALQEEIAKREALEARIAALESS